MSERCAFSCPPEGCVDCEHRGEQHADREIDDRGAVIEGEYRYRLWRRWRTGGGTVLWVGLNPSTADATEDDQTIRRCRTLADLWGYGGIEMVNLYALRSRDPAALATHPDPIGPDCDRWIERLVGGASITVACWGSHVEPVAGRRRQLFLDVLPRLHVLGFTADGSPRHPSRMPNIPAPIAWEATWTPANMLCTSCGHAFRCHIGEHGPCQAYTGGGEGKINTIAGTNCACSKFTRPVAA